MRNVAWLRPEAKPRALGARMSEFFARYIAVIEGAADAIAAEASDPAARRAALAWKVECVALGQSAALRPDPLAALFDAWTLCRQLRVELTDGPGRERFGAAQSRAVAAIDRLEGLAVDIARTVVASPDLSPMQAMVDEAVVRYPIDGPLLSRQSPVIDFADRVGEAGGLAELAASMDKRAADVAQQLRVVGSLAPRQARWQAELLVAEPLAALVETTGRVASALETLPDRVRDERRALTTWMRGEREAILEAVDAQRLALVRALGDIVAAERTRVLEAVAAERTAILAAVKGERETILAAVAAERAALVDAIDAQRVATLETLAGERAIVVDAACRERRATTEAVRDVVEDAFPRTRGLIDHFVLRIGLLGAIAFVAVTVLVIVLRRRAS